MNKLIMCTTGMLPRTIAQYALSCDHDLRLGIKFIPQFSCSLLRTRQLLLIIITGLLQQV